MKYKYTFEEFVKAGGRASAKKRLAGKTKEEISEFMKKVRAGREVKEKQRAEELRQLELRVSEAERKLEEMRKREANRYPEGIE